MLSALFVDQFNLMSLMYICMYGRSASTVWHFEPLSSPIGKIIGVLRYLGIFRAEIQQVKHQFPQVRSDSGEGAFHRGCIDSMNICSRIREEKLLLNQFIAVLESLLPSKYTILYLEQLAEKDIYIECKRIALTEWIMREQLRIQPDQCVLLIKSRQWFSYLQAHSMLHGVHLVSYKYFVNPHIVKKIGNSLFASLRRVTVNFIKKAFRNLYYPSSVSFLKNEHRITGVTESSPVLAIRYGYRKLSFDPSERSEFFWLGESGIPSSDVLVYGFETDMPLEDEVVRELTSRRVRVFGKGPGITAWYPTKGFLKKLLQIEAKFLSCILRCIMRGEAVSPYYLAQLQLLALRYAYWYDFFAANRVKMIIGTFFSVSIAESMALEALNGVSATYQYSISNINRPSSLLTGGEDIQFVFSPLFEDLFRSNESPVNYYIHTGFIYDKAIKNMSNLKRISERVQQLRDMNVKFIICFFDENSRNTWDAVNSYEDSAKEYEFILKWLLDDPSLGVVFKPKKSFNLFERISRISPLIDKAMQTNRCIFLNSDYLSGDIYPAEAAMMADVCVGKILGGTAALESRIAGTPTVLVDTDGYSAHWFHTWKKGRIVYNSWESLRKAVESYRSDPEACPGFGDWTSYVSELDPFRDGKASMRMGFFIHWIYKSLLEGKSKHSALDCAAKQYAQQWGEEYLSRTC